MASLRDLGKKLFAPPVAGGGNDPYTPLKGAADQISQYKQAALNSAQQLAAASHRQPTLEDYRLACQAFGQTEEGKKLVEQGQWGPKIYADLSGQDIKHFQISEPHKRATTDLMDQDGDHAVNDFYANIDFTGANLKDCIVDPATSFNDEIAKAASVEGLTFNNMQTGDEFVFGTGQYKNIKLTNIHGGKITFSENSQVDGIDISGVQAEVALAANASVHSITVDRDTRILKLDMEPGAAIIGSDLRDATISMASNLKGAVFQDVTFGGNLTDVNMNGAILRKVNFAEVGANALAGLDLRGATLEDVTIDGKPLTNRAQLAALGIQADNSTQIAASPEFKMQLELAKITDQARSWNHDLHQQAVVAAKEPEKTNAPAPAKASGKAPSAPVLGGGSVDSGMDQFTAMNKDMAAPLSLQEPPQPFLAALAQLPTTKLTPVEVEEAGASLSTNQAVFNLRKVQPAPDQTVSRTRNS